MHQQILAKVPNMRFQENVSDGSSAASRRQMDRHDEGISLIVATLQKHLKMGPWAWKTPVHIFATCRYQFIIDYATKICCMCCG